MASWFLNHLNPNLEQNVWQPFAPANKHLKKAENKTPTCKDKGKRIQDEIQVWS